MQEPKLLLKTSTQRGDKTFPVPLHNTDAMDINYDSTGVFSDAEYSFVFEGVDLSEIRNIHVFINGSLEKSYYDGSSVIFPFNFDGFTHKRRKIFADYFGFVDIEVEFVQSSGMTDNLHTGYLPVLVRKDQQAEGIRKMISFIEKHEAILLQNGDTSSRVASGFRENGVKNLITQIQLAEDIAAIFEKQYGYFMANARFTTSVSYNVDHLEKLTSVDSATLRYIVTHPEQLYDSHGVGIHYRNSRYMPRKTLVQSNQISRDTFENRAMLSFLLYVIDSIAGIKQKLNDITAGLETSGEQEDFDGYILSSYFVFGDALKHYGMYKERIDKVLSKYQSLYFNYSKIFGIDAKSSNIMPKPTPVFTSIPQYNQIYIAMYKWFTFGIYDFSEESLLLSFIRISTLYESYSLARLVVELQSNGYELMHRARFVYPTKEGMRYQNTICNNTYTFVKDRKEIVVYYQPLIRCGEENILNGFSLFRNTEYSIGSVLNAKGSYYTPDFVIKIRDESGTKYRIADSKYSSAETVREKELRDLILKYLFSISASEKDEMVDGMFVFCGKSYGKIHAVNVHDRDSAANPARPFTYLIPLTEYDEGGEKAGSDGLVKLLDI